MEKSYSRYIIDVSEDPILIGSLKTIRDGEIICVDEMFIPGITVYETDDSVNIGTKPTGEKLSYRNAKSALLFDRLLKNLPLIKDPIVQKDLLLRWWAAMGLELERVTADDETVRVDGDTQHTDKSPSEVYLILPAMYSALLYDAVREVISTMENSFHFRTILNEILCTIIYYVDSIWWREEMHGQPCCVCIIQEGSKNTLRVLRLRSDDRNDSPSIRLLEYSSLSLEEDIEATCAELLEKRQDENETSVYLIHVDDEETKKRIGTALGSSAPNAMVVHWQTKDTRFPHEAKVKGAERLVRRFRQEALETPPIFIEHYYNWGVGFGADHFHLLISQETIAAASNWPVSRSEMFEVQVPLMRSISLNLYCGHSDKVDDAVLLGALALNVRHFRGHSDFEILVSLSLEDRLSGKSSLYFLPPDTGKPSLVDEISFRLPPLIG